ncbi:MAG: HpcH/HpaI aldolase/citrate lyase family protein [Candidatus Marinimicrobia bacterium]|nr:HpcH/HpaI aldolase/citrate lyase family protein [Candidatus Neomarinimicrobiota bacterium]
MKPIFSAGNSGPDVQSDCRVSIKLNDTGGIQIILNSKVQKYYENQLINLIKNCLNQAKIVHCECTLEDYGALDYVILARIEAAVNKALGKEIILLPVCNNRSLTIKKDAERRSRLYLPGDFPKFFINAGLYKSDGLIFDLEDSVAPEKKEEVRPLVRNAMLAGDYFSSEIMVRINQLPMGLKDLEYVVPYGVDTILIPKCESADQVLAVANKIEDLKKQHHLDKEIYIMPIIENAMGVIKSFEIATASDKNIALTIGLEDYTADLGVERTDNGKESEFARNMIINAARAAGIQAIDSVFSNVEDMNKLFETARNSKAMGFDGMGCIHPRQISVIHQAFAPTEKEIEKAKKIAKAFAQAKKEGKAVVSLNSKMIDPPVVKRAERVIKMAIQNKLLTENWEELEND